METLKQCQENWFNLNAPMGKALGYPDCCIKEFCNQPPEYMQNSKATDNDRLRYIAGCINDKFTGFIPCTTHAIQILSGKITLVSLITQRDSTLPVFPNA